MYTRKFYELSNLSKKMFPLGLVWILANSLVGSIVGFILIVSIQALSVRFLSVPNSCLKHPSAKCLKAATDDEYSLTKPVANKAP